MQNIFDVSDLEVIKTEEYIDLSMSAETEKALDFAAKTLREGGIVAFPTETVYGLGANAFDIPALRRIFEAKGRPADNPLIVHISRARDIEQLASKIPVKTIKLIDAFWPGPLTVILPKRSEVPDEATGGLTTVAIRMPSDPVAMELIRRAGVPVAAPSANLSGRPSPTKGSHVEEDLADRADVILKGKDCKIGIESTVIDLCGDIPVILRPGIITKAQIEDVIGTVELDSALILKHKDKLYDKQKETELAPRSPGMKYTHYAPKAAMTIIEGDSDEKKIKKIREFIIKAENVCAGVAAKQAALIITDELSDILGHGSQNQTESSVLIFRIGSRGRPQDAACRFFSILRECDEAGIESILAEAIEADGVGLAVMDRMIKSAGLKVIHV